METITTPILSEYSSAYRPVADKPAIAGAQNTAAKTASERSTQTNNSASENILNDINPFSKSAPLPEERSVLRGMFNDVLKTLSKILTGALLTDILKGLLKDGGQTWEQIFYRSCMDNLPSRFLTDLVNSFTVRLFNGNHKLFGIPLYLPPELSSQIFAIPTVLISRSATKDDNVNANSAEANMSEQEKAIYKALKESNHWFVKFSEALSSNFQLYVKPICNKMFQVMLGIHAGKKLRDKEGNFILDKKGKPLESNPIVNKAHLFGFVGATYFGSFFLPRFTTSFGFEKAQNPLRAALATAATTLCRINTTILHNGSGMHRVGGKNFDACYNTSVVEKTLVPLAQYSCDALGTILSKHIPMNGATIANTIRLIIEIPVTFLSSGLVNVAKNDRMDPGWAYLGHKICKPFLSMVETVCRPGFELLSRFVYGPLLGMFDSSIPNMYGVDIRTEETKRRSNLDPKIIEKFKDKNIFALFVQKHLELLKDVITLLQRCGEDSRVKVAKINDKVRKANEAIDLRLAAEAAMNQMDLGTNVFKPENKSVEVNKQIVEAVKSGKKKEDLVILLSAKNSDTKTKRSTKTTSSVGLVA